MRVKGIMLEEIKFRLKGIWRFLTVIFRQFVEDECQATAAALTYQTLFAVVPLLTVTYALLNAFDAFGGMSSRLEEFLFVNIVPENVGMVQDYLRDFSAQAKSLSGPSLALLAITAFLMLFTIERTFNEIWRVREPRHGFQRFLMYWAVLSMSPFLIGMGFAISTYVMSLPFVSGVPDATRVLQYMPVLLSAALFTMIYLAVPNCVVSMRHAAVGGILVAIGFEMAKVGFATIMANSNFEVIYGTFAAVPLFLLWIYLSWTIVLIGAEIVKGLSVFRFRGDEKIESPMIQLLLILELFYQAHQRGETVREGDIRALSDRIDVAEWNEYKARLTELNLIKSLDKGGVVLSKDLKEVTVWDLYQQVPYDMPVTIGGEKSWEHDLAERLGKISGRGMDYLKMDLETLFRSEFADKHSLATEASQSDVSESGDKDKEKEKVA